MGNPLKKILPWIDPIGNQGAKAIANTTGLGADPKTAAAPPGYDPSKNPGSHLFSPPPGGPPGAGGPSSALFGGGGVNPSGSAYSPNFWQTRPGSIGSGQQLPSRIGGSGVGVNPNVNPFRGGVGMPPATATGGQGMPPGGPTNPLQQQQIIAQMLRNGQAGQPPMMATHQ